MYNDYITNKTHSVFDYESTKAFKQMPLDEWFSKSPPFDCRNEFIEKIDYRIKNSNLNQIIGLERFGNKHVINGTTQAFDEAYWLFKNRRLRIFRGEYAYHRRVNLYCPFIEDEPLAENDYLIISVPFCSTGDVHLKLNETLDQAYNLNIPVIIDCAYWGTCWGIIIDVSHPAIHQVCFSLTKSLGLGDMRSGIRYSNINFDTPITQQHDYNHLQLMALKIGIYMMDRFDPDHIPNKFREAQESACFDAQITPTKCMHLALGDKNWGHYKIDNMYNRLGIRQLVKERYSKRI